MVGVKRSLSEEGDDTPSCSYSLEEGTDSARQTGDVDEPETKKIRIDSILHTKRVVIKDEHGIKHNMDESSSTENVEEAVEESKETEAEDKINILSMFDAIASGQRDSSGVNAEALLGTDPELAMKPKLNYRQLAYLAMKNANFMPLQTPHICDFVEKTFPYFASGTESKRLKWRNALSGGVRTAKCDDRLFRTDSMWGSGVRMFYSMNMDRALYFEEQIVKWRATFDESNVHESGLRSLEELDLVVSGKMGVEWIIPDPEEHMEKYRKSTCPDLNQDTVELEPQHCHPAAMSLFEQGKTSTSKVVRAAEEEEQRQKEKAELRRQRKNEKVECPACKKMVSRKSLPRHLRQMHNFSDADMRNYRLEEKLNGPMYQMNSSRNINGKEDSVDDLEEEDNNEEPEANSVEMTSSGLFHPAALVSQVLTLCAESSNVNEKTENHEDVLRTQQKCLNVMDIMNAMDEDENITCDLELIGKTQLTWNKKTLRIHCRLCNARVSKSSLPRHLRTLHKFTEDQVKDYHAEERIEFSEDNDDVPSTSSGSFNDSQNDSPEATSCVPPGDLTPMDKEKIRSMWKNRKTDCRLCETKVSRKSLSRHLKTKHGLVEKQLSTYYIEEAMEKRAALICPHCNGMFATSVLRRFHEESCTEVVQQLILKPQEDVKPEICIRLGANGPAC